VFLLSASCLVHTHRIAALARQVGRQAIHQADADIGVNPAEQARRDRVSDNRVQHPGAPPTLGEPIAVPYHGLEACQIDLCTMGMELDSKLISPKSAAPSVVIASGECDGHAGPPQGAERLESRIGASWDDRPVLEPKLEKVPIDYEVIAKVRYGFEEPME